MSTQVMLDLETVGNGKNSAIVSIGAVPFNANGIIEGNDFYREINLQSCFDEGLQADGSTIAWWMQQSEEARQVFDNNDKAEHLLIVLDDLRNWMSKLQVKEVWGCGSDFDNAILSNAYRKVGIAEPWKFWNNRCYRTLKSLFPGVKIDREGTVHHNALGDAEAQTKHLLKIMKVIGK